ncbi:hypothetical protein [Methylobacterium planeticum]|uniref:Uncharacterized protein n=1 Tax=Methylobacterium planeticum TaxID=2615211 RepID=A0A6N6MM15_9HYPH|nr:hypothetical protein [Methylobacterium planeticum]KAB1070856.1 hypothetical protein F6X51_21255 [Methylobacterium planeticum]
MRVFASPALRPVPRPWPALRWLVLALGLLGGAAGLGLGAQSAPLPVSAAVGQAGGDGLATEVRWRRHYRHRHYRRHHGWRRHHYGRRHWRRHHHWRRYHHRRHWGWHRPYHRRHYGWRPFY